MPPTRVILCVTDSSNAAAWALRVAQALARDRATRLVTLEMSQPPLPRVSMGRAVVCFPAHGLRPGSWTAANGSSAAQILQVAGEVSCDLIVLGTAPGSVADEVRKGARCPVVAVLMPVP